jgi:7,8-dihydropterin-6-yl-methyl-4-(beta-D-ribofuranosyl)aminobenzene 5'-phosphate synthase
LGRLDKTILFDTGGNGDILLANMQRLGLEPQGVNAVVFSHIHADHTGDPAPF